MLLQKNPNIQGAEGSEYRLFTVALMLGKVFIKYKKKRRRRDIVVCCGEIKGFLGYTKKMDEGRKKFK